MNARNLVVCCDGTWNTPDQMHDGVPVPTNVVRLFNALAGSDKAGQQQLTYYHPGVGTEGNWWSKLKGGGLGIGLDKNVMSGYRWLGGNYQDGDRIFLFGFSRGAFTVRSLSGMIGCCGLLDLSDLDEAEVWKRVETTYAEGYRARRPRSEWGGSWKIHEAHPPVPGGGVPIHFLGVWDTVGALGVPDDLAILNLFDNPRKYQFHDTKLSDRVLHARHAVALDERRASFTPTLWTDVEAHQSVKQVWFPGVHSDVGGGYPETGLSNSTLLWMIGEATGKSLAFNEDMVGQVVPNPRDVLHDSADGVFKVLRTQPRSTPRLDIPGASVHDSVGSRRANPPIAQAPYWACRTIAVGEEVTFPVFAAQPWNVTGLYLEQGARYRFTAKGEWLDRTIKSGPSGTHDGHFQPGEIVHVVGTLFGKIETLYDKVTHDPSGDFNLTRREEGMPWFSLVGVIANGGNPKADGTPTPHETFLIGDGCTYPPAGLEKPGYLYGFANDAWHFYGNNRGSVVLKVERLS